MSSSSPGQTLFFFTEHDLAAFSEASGDRNPLHLSREYAQRTPYGQPVVFGCLGAMACLGQFHLPAGWGPASLEAEFLRPMFLGVQYRVETSEKDGKWTARLLDGSTPVVPVKVTATPSGGEDIREGIADVPAFERSMAAVRRPDDLIAGLTISGVYACNAAALAAVAARWGVADGCLATLLCWSSYVVGMELPGESALFSKLLLRFEARARCPGTMEYQASVASVDSRVGQFKAEVSLRDGESTIVSGQYWSYIRPPAPEVEDVDSALAKPDGLAGRTAVLLGSSRGLGAVIQRALELRGAAVYGMARSREAGGHSRTEVGDASNPEALRRMRERISQEQGRVDFLICNACPPILPLRLEPNGAERIASYINLVVSLTLAPLCEFLDLLNRSDGCAVIVSSAAVEHPVREWPHYIAAKRAVEALGCAAAMQYPRVGTLIVRPPKLLTTMTNTPMGRLGAVSPGLLANRIAARLENPPAPGKTEVLE